MDFDLQPILENDLVKIQPLNNNDFEFLYKIASDPLIWEQHPNKDRYKKEVFERFFKDAMDSGGAFLVIDKKTDEIIGSSRYYDVDINKSVVAIGYTFLARSYWGSNYNKALKQLMLDHAFKFVNAVTFQVGINNLRSQKAIEKLGAIKISQIEIDYAGENNRMHFVYEFKKKN